MSGGSDTKESSFTKWSKVDKERRRVFQVERTTGTETGNVHRVGTAVAEHSWTKGCVI